MKPLRIAFIGARGHHPTVLRELEKMPEAQITAICDGGDTIEPLAEWCRTHSQTPKVFSDYHQLIDPSLADLLVVCGPFEKHAEMSLAAIERDLPVLCEKPVALTFADLNKLRDACHKHPRALFTGMMFSRYDPGFFTAWNLVQSGAIGEIRLINARKSYKLATRPPYYEKRETYGGTIPWIGSHAFDWMLWFSNQSPQSVCATHSTVSNGNHGDMESSASCQFSFANGLSATVSLDIMRPPNAPTHGDDWMRLVGTTGVIEARPNSVHLINPANDGSQPVAVASDRFLMRDIAEQLAGGQKCLIDTASTLALTDTCLRARQSADENRVVNFSENYK